jgi:hypothetical protein
MTAGVAAEKRQMGFARSGHRWLAAASLAALASACSAPAHTTPPAGAADPAFARAKTECTEQAVAATQATNPQGLASKAAIGIYVRCMEEKGFPGGAAPR